MLSFGGLADLCDVTIRPGMSSGRKKEQGNDHRAAGEFRLVQGFFKQRLIESVLWAGPTFHRGSYHLPHVATEPGLQLARDVVAHLGDVWRRAAVIDENHGRGRRATGHRRPHPLFENDGDAFILGRVHVDQGRRHPHPQPGVAHFQLAHSRWEIIRQRPAGPKEERHDHEIASAVLETVLQRGFERLGWDARELIGRDGVGMQKRNRLDGLLQSGAEPDGSLPQAKGRGGGERAVVHEQNGRSMVTRRGPH